MRRYTKDDVETRCERYERHPAVNVKVRNLPALPYSEQAIEWAFELAQESFWEYWQDQTGDLENGLTGSAEYAYFPGYTVRAECQGRMGGWLVITGLPPVEEWDAILLARWRKFERSVLEDVRFQTSADNLRDAIEANRWDEPGAEKYNFRDTRRGTLCAADVYRMTHEYPLVTA